MVEKRFDPNKAEVLISKERRALLPVDKIVRYLEIEKNDVVADLGAGNGYFTIPMAKKTDYSVYSVDIEPRMLTQLKEVAEKESIENIHYIQSDLETIQLEDRSVDKVMAAFVIHEVPDPIKAFSEIKRILKPDGKLLLIEWETVEAEIGPLLEDKISSLDMTHLLEQNGFNTEILRLNEKNYGIVAKFA